jgi:hypothetical protein
MLNYSEEMIDNLSYKDLEKDRTKILNLKNTDFFEQFFSGE